MIGCWILFSGLAPPLSQPFGTTDAALERRSSGDSLRLRENGFLKPPMEFCLFDRCTVPCSIRKMRARACSPLRGFRRRTATNRAFCWKRVQSIACENENRPNVFALKWLGISLGSQQGALEPSSRSHQISGRERLPHEGQ